MANTLKKGASQLKELAGTATTEEVQVETSEVQKKVKKVRKEQSIDTVLIGAHFPRAVRRSLAQLQADPRNDRKRINDLLAEALNDLFAKYNVPQTAHLGKID
jgi:hypothetical protein